MVNSEYPDLPFIPPAAYGAGRPAPPRVIVVHYTAGAERSTSAEDGAAYDQRRSDGTSTHYFCDSDSVVQCVYTWDRANAALWNGNRIGIQYELCGTVQSRQQWLDAPSSATLTNAARQIARDCAKYKIPIRKLTYQQVAAGESGICAHADITRAYPADGGDHMDPGPEFPWDVLLQRIVQAAASGATATALEDDMTPEQAKKLDAVHAAIFVGGDSCGAKTTGTPVNPGGVGNALVDQLAELRTKSAAPPAVVDPLALAAALAGNEVFVRNLAASMASAMATEAGRRLVNG